MSGIWSNSDAMFKRAIDAGDNAERSIPRFVLVIADGECDIGGRRTREKHGVAIYKRDELSVSSLRYYERNEQFTVKELDRRDLIKELTGLEAESDGEN